jgi:catechol 2,3-dioxygenase-like lactoylglutathione lyase family enzyme
MFERFTERARQVVVLSQDEARRLGHGYIGVEHLLLGLMREAEGLAARALAEAGLTADAVRDRVRLLVGKGESAPTGQMPFTPHAKRALEQSLVEAQQLGHSFIGTEHVLLGLLRVSDAGPAAAVLYELDTSPRLLAQRLIAQLGSENDGAFGDSFPEPAAAPAPATHEDDVVAFSYPITSTVGARLTIDHCVIAVSDWERSNRFYRDVLGAEIDQKDAYFGHYRFGGWQLNVHGPGFEGLNAERPVEPGNSDLCFVWAGPIEQAVEHLEAHGVEMIGPLDGDSGARGPGRHVYFRDPDGSLLEFVSYTRGPAVARPVPTPNDD